MAKNISLNKKQPEKPEKEQFYFFVKNQGTSIRIQILSARQLHMQIIKIS